jgi:hypothetical protein
VAPIATAGLLVGGHQLHAGLAPGGLELLLIRLGKAAMRLPVGLEVHLRACQFFQGGIRTIRLESVVRAGEGGVDLRRKRLPVLRGLLRVSAAGDVLQLLAQARGCVVGGDRGERQQEQQQREGFHGLTIDEGGGAER